jgi:hypothetical protein
MSEWSEDHVVAIGSFKFESWKLWLMSEKIETRRSHLGGPVKHSELKGGEITVVILRFLYCSPLLCWLRTEGLVPVSKYWMYRPHTGDMGQVSLIACYQQMFDFLHCFIGWLVRERNWVRTRGLIGRRVVNCVGSHLSHSYDVHLKFRLHRWLVEQN